MPTQTAYAVPAGKAFIARASRKNEAISNAVTIAVGAARVSPSVDFMPIAQPTSSAPAAHSSNHACGTVGEGVQDMVGVCMNTEGRQDNGGSYNARVIPASSTPQPQVMTRALRRAGSAGLMLAIAGSIFFSGKAVVVKLAYRHGVDAATLIALRMLAAAPFFVLAYAWAARGARPLSGADHLRLIGLGLVGYYAASMFDFLGLQYVTAALERLILYLAPTLVLLLSALFLARRITRRDVLALALAYGGIVCAFWHDLAWGELTAAGKDVPLGAALVFASAVCYAIYLVVCGELVGRLGAIRLTSYAMLVSTVAVLLQFAALRPAAALLQPAPVLWLSLLNGIACTVLPVFAMMMAVERIGAPRASMASMVGPIATIALGWTFLGEVTSTWQWIGTAFVLAGVYVLSRQPAASQPAISQSAT